MTSRRAFIRIVPLAGAAALGSDRLVMLPGDCPLLDPRELDRLPDKIEKKEAALKTIQADMHKPEFSANYAKLQELMKQEEQTKKELEQLFQNWEELEAKRS